MSFQRLRLGLVLAVSRGLEVSRRRANDGGICQR